MYPPPAAGPGTQSPPPGGGDCVRRLAAGGWGVQPPPCISQGFLHESKLLRPQDHRGGAGGWEGYSPPPQGGGDCKGWRLAAGTYIYIYIYCY